MGAKTSEGSTWCGCWLSQNVGKALHQLRISTLPKSSNPGGVRAECPYSPPQAVQTAVLARITLITCSAAAQRRPLVVLQDKLGSIYSSFLGSVLSSEARANVEKIEIPHVLFNFAAACT